MRSLLASVPVLLALCSVAAHPQLPSETPQQSKKGGGEYVGKREFPPPVSGWPEGSVILGCPTDRSIELAIHLKADATVSLVYGPDANRLTAKLPDLSAKGGLASKVKLPNLKPNTAYTYQLVLRQGDRTVRSPIGTFRTQRAPGSTFTYLVQGDSHPERVPKMNVPALYERTLNTAASQGSDFLICLGDDFSVDTLRQRDVASIESVYQRQVPYLGLAGRSSPIFLVNGNHEQAAMANLDGTPNSLGVRVQSARNRNFCQPAPDAFYSGDSEQVPNIGYLRDYYAWTWGDALFVVIDPYWHTPTAVDNEVAKGPKSERGGKRNRDMWDITLGETQYRWLKTTLETSKARYKFVFSHHVLGTGRGGVELARQYEWGGQGRNGREEFASKRPGWEMPIHNLFVKTGVSAFFQGHDHIFCRQELDGVVYQSCPCPADPTNSLINGEAYRTGDKVPGAGVIRVTISPTNAKVDYLRAFEPSAEIDGHHHGETAFSYVIQPGGKR